MKLRMKMKYSVFIIILCMSFISHAAIFIQQDKNGNTIYSDTPLDSNAKRLKMPTGNSLPSQTPESVPMTTHITPQVTETTSLGSENARQDYTSFVIVSPKDQENIQNLQVIPVEVKTVPDLLEGDKVLLLLDGNPWGSPLPTTQLQMENVERGQHSLAAAIVDKDQKVVKQTNTITIYVHRPTLNSPTRQAPPPPPPKAALMDTIVGLFE